MRLVMPTCMSYVMFGLRFEGLFGRRFLIGEGDRFPA